MTKELDKYSGYIYSDYEVHGLELQCMLERLTVQAHKCLDKMLGEPITRVDIRFNQPVTIDTGVGIPKKRMYVHCFRLIRRPG